MALINYHEKHLFNNFSPSILLVALSSIRKMQMWNVVNTLRISTASRDEISQKKRTRATSVNSFRIRNEIYRLSESPPNF